MRLANYFLLMYLASNGLINAAQGLDKPKGTKPDDPGESSESTPGAPVLFKPLHGPRSLAQHEHKLFGDIAVGKDSHAVDLELLQKLLNPSTDGTGIQFQPGGSTFKKKKESGRVRARKSKPKDKGGRHLRGLDAQLAEVDHDIQDILLESADGYAVLAVIPEQNLIVSGHIEQRINGTLGTTYTFIHGPDDPNDPTQPYDITIVDREIQLARTDSGPEHTVVPTDDQSPSEPDHGRRLEEPPSTEDGARIFTIAMRYTPETASILGSSSKVRANAVQIVSSINLFLQNSRVSHLQQLQLGSVEVSELHDSGDSYGSISTFSNLPSTLGRSEDYAMLITNGFGCGVGYLYGAYTPTPANLKKYLTSVVKLSCAIIDKSAAHEKGHNDGLQHNRGSAVDPYRPDFANGYAMMDQYAITGTILAYVNHKPDRYPFYSSAEGTFNINGQQIAMGSPTTDNVGVMKISFPEMYRVLRGGGSVPTPAPKPPTPAPTVQRAPTHSAGQPTRFPTPAAAPTTKRPTTAKPTPRPVAATYRPTAATKRPTVPTKRPTVATKGPTVPTKGPTKKPTTAAPTFDQTPTLALGQTVNFVYDGQTPVKPLVLKFGPPRTPSRTLTLGTRFILTNSLGNTVKPENYVFNKELYETLDFSKDLNFKVVNTDPKVKEADGNQYVYIYYLPPKPKSKRAKTPKPQLLLKLQKNDLASHAEFIDDTFTVDGSDNLKFGATGSVTPPPTRRNRGLTEEDVVLDIPNLQATIDFVGLSTDLANKTPAERAAVVKDFIANNEFALDMIANDWILMHKFMVDTITNLGPYEASKFLRDGVLTELFSKADAETICNAFEVSSDPFLNALCLEYVDNAAETFTDKPALLAEASDAAATLQSSIPNFIRDIVQARLIAESVDNMESFFSKKGALSSEEGALADMFRFAKLDDVVELFRRLATEDKYKIIKSVPEDIRSRNDYLTKIYTDELEGKWEQVGHGRYEKTGRAKPRKA